MKVPCPWPSIVPETWSAAAALKATTTLRANAEFKRIERIVKILDLGQRAQVSRKEFKKLVAMVMNNGTSRGLATITLNRTIAQLQGFGNLHMSPPALFLRHKGKVQRARTLSLKQKLQKLNHKTLSQAYFATLTNIILKQHKPEEIAREFVLKLVGNDSMPLCVATTVVLVHLSSEKNVRIFECDKMLRLFKSGKIKLARPELPKR